MDQSLAEVITKILMDHWLKILTSFVAFTSAVFAITWKINKWYYSRIIESKDAEINLKDEQIKSFTGRLSKTDDLFNKYSERTDKLIDELNKKMSQQKNYIVELEKKKQPRNIVIAEDESLPDPKGVPEGTMLVKVKDK
jgi:hypothetical protein